VLKDIRPGTFVRVGA